MKQTLVSQLDRAYVLIWLCMIMILTYKLRSPITDLANFPAKGKIVCKILSLAWFVESIEKSGPWAAISARKNDFLIKETLDEIVADTIKVIKHGMVDMGN